MRSWLRARWLEVVLLLGLAGLLLWYVNVGLGFVPRPTPIPPVPTQAPTRAPARAPVRVPTRRAVPTAVPIPTLTPEPSPTPTTPTVGRPFDGSAAYQHVLAQVKFGPRPSGSQANGQTQAYIQDKLREYGWQVEAQDFAYKGTNCRNIVGKIGSGPVLILGTHYDTRRRADNDTDPAGRAEPVPGANDGASGVGVLLELARSLDASKLRNQVRLVFFDAEDNGRLDGWDYIAGSTYMAEHLDVTPEYVVIVDMVGDADQNIYRERNSTASLLDRIWTIAAGLNYQAYFLPDFKHTLVDDHLPFIQRGIPAVDLIDFDYPYWHTTQDTPDKVAPASLERVGRVLKALLEQPAA